MPRQINQILMYNDLDEVLNKPSKGMVQYGNMLLFMVIVMVCSISFIVKHEDVIECKATIELLNLSAIQSPEIETEVKKNFIPGDTVLHKGDTILILKPPVSTSPDPAQAGKATTTRDFFILAPYDCKVAIKRMLEPGEILRAATLVANITAPQNKYNIKLEIPEKDALKVKIGLKVKINPGNPSDTFYDEFICQIISTPYVDTVTKKTVAEARLEFVTKNKKEEKSHFIFTKNTTAGIVTGKKSLAAAFTEF
jgi:hypothetical protein